MRRMILTVLTGLLLAGCASNNQHDTSNNNLPLAVQSAFMSEYPYAKIDQSQQGKDPAGNEIFVISYSNPDGSKGTAFYGPSGESKSNAN